MIGVNQYISVLSAHMVMIGVNQHIYQVLSAHMVMIGVNQYISST